MSDQELAAFLSGVCYGRDEPWERSFKAACCDCCPTVKGTDEYGRHCDLHECDFLTVYVLTGTASSGGWYGRNRRNRSVSSGSLPGGSAPHPDLSLSLWSGPC